MLLGIALAAWEYNGSPVHPCQGGDRPAQAPEGRAEGGGWYGSRALPRLWGVHMGDPARVGWTRVSALPNPKRHHGVLWLGSGISVELESSLFKKGHTLHGRVRQYLFGTTGESKPACPTQSTPERTSYDSKRGTLAGTPRWKPRVPPARPWVLVQVFLRIQWQRGKADDGGGQGI